MSQQLITATVVLFKADMKKVESFETVRFVCPAGSDIPVTILAQWLDGRTPAETKKRIAFAKQGRVKIDVERCATV